MVRVGLKPTLRHPYTLSSLHKPSSLIPCSKSTTKPMVNLREVSTPRKMERVVWREWVKTTSIQVVEFRDHPFTCRSTLSP